MSQKSHILLHTIDGCIFVAPIHDLGIPRCDPEANTGVVIWNGDITRTRETPAEILKMLRLHSGGLVSVRDSFDAPDPPPDEEPAPAITNPDAILLANGVQAANAVFWRMERDAGRPNPCVAMTYERGDPDKPKIREALPEAAKNRIAYALVHWSGAIIEQAIEAYEEELKLLSGGFPVHCGA